MILNFDQFNESKTDGVLYTHGGVLPGHVKEISDKDFKESDINKYDKDKSRSEDRAYYAAMEKWKERFKDYFGTSNEEIVSDFLNFYGRSIKKYNDDKEAAMDFHINKPTTGWDIIYQIQNEIKYPIRGLDDILKHFDIEPTEEGVYKLAELFPQMESQYQISIKNKKFKGEAFEKLNN